MLALTRLYGYGLRLWEFDFWPGQTLDTDTLHYLARAVSPRRPHRLVE